ncbi:MAG: 3-beta-hydroxy-Delta(5)-steroid dehydrogenase [Candidatus Mesenet longicola]|uniref:3-beta-hydroxy-Delta(5)-steroid dehydrogenase n=1 Tax=Candidatus Mesenet longicola TaxID=1892558 RepID=A0A8J3HNY8_9RICK|nr:MAG: 3-beta-hydroxy-Delta(5)-steroid dehydrogenase [Candidatus Mesenet longicola]GHM59023.1 MAG: 3-beta-hydroxy-Delta(5)-steroid dehydrogenase [Candidatus Mesenet longicola]
MIKQVIIFGGSGFLGKYIVKHLADLGYAIKIFSRNQEKVKQLKLCGHPEQIVVVGGYILDESVISKHIKGCDIVINLIGILNESKTQNFHTVHVDIAEKIARVAKANAVSFMIHFSAMNLESSYSSKYAQSKLLGEEVVTSAFPEAIIIRPSLVFGEEDNFFNKFAKLASILPFLPLINNGKMKFQPVYVDDLAKFVCYLIKLKDHDQKLYHIGGPKVYSIRNLLKFIITITNRKCLLINIPLPLAKLIAFICELKFISILLKPITGSVEPLITRDQVKFLCNSGDFEQSHDLEKAKIRATPIESIIPKYLKIYKKV